MTQLSPTATRETTMSRFGFRLTPIPDETLFGLAVTSGLLMGARTYWDAFRLIYGKNADIWSNSLEYGAGRLELLLTSIDIENVESLIEKHTSWPYFTAFTKADALDVAKIRTANGESPKQLFGLTGTQPVSESRYAKYCPTCAREQAIRYRRTTWLRSHQLPGVCTCHKHGQTLFSSQLPLVKGISLSQAIEFPKPAAEVFSGDIWLTRQVWRKSIPNRLVAEVSHDLLASPRWALTPETVVNLYRKALSARGLLADQNYDWAGIEKLFRSQYGDLFCRQWGIDFACIDRTSWLRRLLSGTECYRHPFRHAIVMGCLFDEFPSGLTLSCSHSEQIPARIQELEPKDVSCRVGSADCDRRDNQNCNVVAVKRGKLTSLRSGQPTDVVDRESLRKLLLAVLETNPSVSKNQIRDRIGRWNYHWMLHNDASWMDTVLPTYHRRSRRKGYVIADWTSRDQSIAEIIRNLSLGERQRLISRQGKINLAALARFAAVSISVIRKTAELPRTRDALRGVLQHAA